MILSWLSSVCKNCYLFCIALLNLSCSEETAEDVRAVMHAIQENETAQMRDLTSFLDLEIHFVQQYLDVLVDVRSDWPDRYVKLSLQDPYLIVETKVLPGSKTTKPKGFPGASLEQ